MPIYVIVGDDTFSVKNKAQQLIRDAAVDDFSVSTYDVSETPLDDALNDAFTVPFMSDSKAVIVRHADFFSAAQKASIYRESSLFEHLATVDLEHVILIFLVTGKKVLSQPALLKKIVDRSDVIIIEPKKSGDLKAWIDRQLAKASIEMSGPAKTLLYQRTTHDAEVAYQEIKKLLLYAYDSKTIDIETVDQLITPVLDDDVFKIIHRMLAGQKTEAFQVIEDFLAAKMDALSILTAFIHKFRELALTQAYLRNKMSQDQLASTLNVSPGRAYYMIKNAQAMPTAHVESELRRLSVYDQQIKTGLIDKNLALELFVLGH